MAKNRRDNDDTTVVNYASPGSVVGMQCGSISNTTVTVNGDSGVSGRWIDPEDIDHDWIASLNDY